MRIDLVGTPNFRDFGAQKSTVKGQTIGAGRLFRAGHLSELTAPDIECVRALELTHLFDLRRISEQSQYPNSAGVVESIPCVLPLPIAPGHQHCALEALAEFASSPNDSHEFMCAIYREFARSHSATFRAMFASLLNHDAPNLLVHCAAGKDRTGFAVALILLALGVEVEQVMADYLLTRQYFLADTQTSILRQKYGFEALPESILVPIVDTRREYLEAAFDEARRQAGSLEAYLSEVLALGPAERAHLTRLFVTE